MCRLAYQKTLRVGLLVIASILLIACTVPPELEGPSPTLPLPTVDVTDPIPTPSPHPTATLLRTVAPPTSSPPREPNLQICSPLDGIPRSELADIISNPFSPPLRGSDNPHQGIDLSILDPITRVSLEGKSVAALLKGEVVAVIANRFPYGNAILVETPLEILPVDWISKLQLPEPDLTLEIQPSLTCPDAPRQDLELGGQGSLYVLYAHLREVPQFERFDPISCGDILGAIGGTGNALNPHLHLEIRVGPAKAPFTSMAHYDTSASPEEMAAYCTWRVSGMFLPIDPIKLISPP